MSRHLGDKAVLPELDDLNRAWFTSGSIRVQACDDCGAFQHPPDDVCRSCRGTRFTFRECSGEGRIESVAVVHHAIGAGLKDAVPYAVVVVSIDGAPGANAIGNVVGREPAEVAIGQRVRAVFEIVEDPEGGPTLHIPQWETVNA